VWKIKKNICIFFRVFSNMGGTRRVVQKHKSGQFPASNGREHNIMGVVDLVCATSLSKTVVYVRNAYIRHQKSVTRFFSKFWKLKQTNSIRKENRGSCSHLPFSQPISLTSILMSSSHIPFSLLSHGFPRDFLKFCLQSVSSQSIVTF
jgi:hypothetical protein